MKKETITEKEYYNRIMLGIQAWGLIIMYYVPKLKELGISNNDIIKNFKEILEAHIGEQLYQSNVQKIKRREQLG